MARALMGGASVLAALVSLGVFSTCEAQDLKTIIRLGAFKSDPQGDAVGRFHSTRLEFDPAIGYRASIERKAGSIVGFDFKVALVTHDVVIHDIDLDGRTIDGRQKVRTAGIDLLFHPLTFAVERHVDWYLGFGLSYVGFVGRKSGFGDIGDVAAPVLRTGLDVNLGGGGRWALNVDAQRLFTSTWDRDESNHYQPSIYGAALAIRF